MKKKFVLLDRDGTITVEKHYLSDPKQVELIPGASKGLKKLMQLQLGLIVITNQSGIGRKFFEVPTLNSIHRRMKDLLLQDGVILDDIYYCPHLPEDHCSCRKPNTGLVEKAKEKHHFDLKECFVIGDKALDIELGKNIGATTFLVRTGYGRGVEKENIIKSDYVVDALSEAADIIQQQLIDFII